MTVTTPSFPIWQAELGRICEHLREADRAEARDRLGRAPLDHELGRTPRQRRLDAMGHALQDHLAFLDVCVGPAVEGLGPLARTEWAVAREGLVDARELAGRPGRSTEVSETLAGHAEQMEQVVLPRLVGELIEQDLSDLTAEALRSHEALTAEPERPSAMRARITDHGPDPSRPAGAAPSEVN